MSFFNTNSLYKFKCQYFKVFRYLRDVKDQSVLKIHEQQAAPSAQSPAYSALHQQIPIRWTTTSKSPQSAPVSPPSVPPEYFSEPEFELNRASSRYNNWDSGAAYDGRLSLQQQQQPARPASVQPTHYLNHHQHQHQGHQQGINSNSNNRNYYGNSSSSRRERFPLPPEKQHNVGQGHGQGERAQRWMMSNGGQGESYNNCGEIHGQQNDSQQTAAMAYNSDSSSHYARSGSSTPVLDRNTWAKIDSVRFF